MDFFISYTAADAAWAKWIAWQLQKEGYDCVVQAWDFRPGSDFMQQMRSAMQNAKQTIAVLSPDYLKSKFATAELNVALVADPTGTQGKLLPIRIRDCSPPDLLRGRVYIDLVGKDAKVARRDLLEGVRASQVGRVRPKDALRFPARPAFPDEQRRASSPSVQSPETRTLDRGPLKILFLASEAGTGLDLRGEYRGIKAAIAGAKFATRIHLAAVFDATAETLLQSLNAYSPHVFHLSGRQDGGAILLNSKDGGVKTISDAALAGLLRSLDRSIRLAVIDTCFSLRCAASVAAVIDCALGVKRSIYEEDATTFYRVFYRAIASGRSLQDAYGQARAALRFERVPKSQIPQLRCRPGVDPQRLMLVAPSPPASARPRGRRLRKG